MTAKEKSTGIIIKGDEVSFLRPDADEYFCPPTFVILHDVTGKDLRRCDFYIVRAQAGTGDDLIVSDSVYDTAIAYFANDAELKEILVDIPGGPWNRIGEVHAIRYRRKGKHAGDYEHPYDPPVVLYRCERPHAYRLRLPDSCIVDERGFVSP